MPIVPPFTPSVGSVPNITPFTMRDGRTYLEEFKDLVKYFNRYVVPYINENIATLSEKWDEDTAILVAAFNAAVAEMNEKVDNGLQDMSEQVAAADAAKTAAEAAAAIAENAASTVPNIQDANIAGFINSVTSATRIALDTIYAKKSDVTSLTSRVTDTENDVATLETRTTDTETDIAALEANAQLKTTLPVDASRTWLTGTMSTDSRLDDIRQAMVNNGNVRIVCLGSSTMQGANVSQPDMAPVNRMAYRMGATSVPALDTAPTTGTGIQWYQGAAGGTTSATYLTPTKRSQITALQPKYVLHMIGSNDWATGVNPSVYAGNISTEVVAIEAAVPGVVNVLIHSQPRLDGAGAFPWAQYGTALKGVADAGANRVFIDLTAGYFDALINGTNKWNMIQSDNIHLTDNGYRKLADILCSIFGIPIEKDFGPNVSSLSFTAGGDLTAGATLATMDIPAAPYPRRIRILGNILVRNITGEIEMQYGLYTSADAVIRINSLRKASQTANDPVTCAGSFYLAPNTPAKAKVICGILSGGTVYVSQAAPYTAVDVDITPA